MDRYNMSIKSEANGSEALSGYTIAIQVTSVLAILMSYIFNHAFIWIGVAACTIFLLSNVGWEQRFSLFYFLFPFSWVFTAGADHDTNVFMVIRIVMIIAVLLYKPQLIKVTFVSICIFFALYCMCISGGSFGKSLKHLVNIVIWFSLCYFTNSTLHSGNILPISRSLSNGVIISGIIAMNVDKIPTLFSLMRISNVLSVSGDIQVRFTGLFSDPNIFSVIICVTLWSVYYEFSRSKISLVEYSIRAFITSFYALLTLSKSGIILLMLYWAYVIFSINNISITYKFVISIFMVSLSVYYLIKNPDWYMDMVNRFMGNKSNSNVTFNEVTTGRFEIWGWYMKYFYYSNSWIFGNGFGALLVKGSASHNTLIQIFYCVGTVGLIIYYKILKFIYFTVPENIKIRGINKIGVYTLVFIGISSLFLDGLLLEVYYYLISLAFIYMKMCDADSDVDSAEYKLSNHSMKVM